jgi:hypothetical protein
MHVVQEGDDAGQKLAAELLRVLVSQRHARLALRDAGGLQTLMLCLTSSPPQVQQSAFDALKILWSSEEGVLSADPPVLPRFLFMKRKSDRMNGCEWHPLSFV